MAGSLDYILRLRDQFSQTLQGASNKVKGLDGAMGSLKGAIAGAFAVSTVVSFGKAVIESLKNYQYFHASLKTMLQGNEGATKALEDQLITLAKTTPFELTEVQTATKQLMAYGFKAGDVVETIRTLGDVSSGIGAPLGDIAYLYGTLKTSGRVTLMDLRQFAGRGVPIYEVLAKRLNTTTAAINGLASAGKIGFRDVEGAFKDMTSAGGQFFNLMDAQSKTVGGQLSNMADGWEQLKVKIGQSQTGIIAGTTAWINNLLDGLNRGIDAMNLLDKAFEKNEKLQFGFYQKYIDKFFGKVNNLFGISPVKGGQVEMEQYAGQTKEQYVDSSKDRATALRNQISLNVMMKMLTLDKKMESLEKNRRIAILNELKNKNLDNLALFDLKENKSQIEGAGGVDGGKGVKSLGTGTEVTGQRPQAINISIDKLVNELNIQTTNLTEGAGRMKELVSKALLEAVNDINLIAMA
jgi:hypothetical protein